MTFGPEKREIENDEQQRKEDRIDDMLSDRAFGIGMFLFFLVGMISIICAFVFGHSCPPHCL